MRSSLKKNQSKKGWQGGSSGRAPVYQAQDPEFNPQYHRKKEREREREYDPILKRPQRLHQKTSLI
jgi:hypothetical protein